MNILKKVSINIYSGKYQFTIAGQDISLYAQMGKMSGVNMIKFERLKQYEQKEGSRTTADASAANTDKTAGMAVKRMLAYGDEEWMRFWNRN